MTKYYRVLPEFHADFMFDFIGEDDPVIRHEKDKMAMRADNGYGVELVEIPVIRETKNGVIVRVESSEAYRFGEEKLVCHTWKKKYAYPSKEQALQNFIERRKIWKRFLVRDLERCKSEQECASILIKGIET